MGGGLRAARMLASGDLQLIVLALLEEKSRHGYEIIKALEDKSSGFYTPSPGVVYPALTYLEEMGFASSETEGNKKLYTITDAGQEHLEKSRELVNETLEHLERFGRKVAHFQKEFADEENVSEDFSHGSRGSRRQDWRQFKGKFRDLWSEMREVLREKRDASMEEKERVYAILKEALDRITNK